MTLLLAWRPFLDPLAIEQSWWLFLFPLVLGISMVYKAVRLPSLQRFWRQTLKMSLQIVAAMVVLAAALFVVVEWLSPRI
ncbi:MAG: hypothetical protein ACF8PN_01455 [Phycisphaerales bacterium]